MLRLLFWTVRYLTPAQVLTRCRRVIRQRWWRLMGSRAAHPTDWRPAHHEALFAGLAEMVATGVAPEEVEAAIGRARTTAGGRFCFLNECVDLGARPGWHDAGLSRLWRYHLHYFDYVNDLMVWSAAGQTHAAYKTFRSQANSWIEGNQKIEGDGWHPFTISVRLVNWLHAASAFKTELAADGDFRLRLFGSIYAQARFLSDDLELDVRGNHLLKNLRALLWAGLAFEGDEPRAWFERAVSLFHRELDEQVLADGGHFERSPGYHLQVLKDCIETGLWLRRNGGGASPQLDGALRRMLDYLSAILPPDGRVPLLKDTAWDAAPTPLDLLAAGALYFDEPTYKRCDRLPLYPFLLFGAPGLRRFDGWPLNTEPRGSLALHASGHYVMRDEAAGEYLIFDAGAVCPEYLPAHGQADMLTYELAVDGQRIVVDSGVYEYAAGEWRDYFRSTRAHNTVEVAGENQSEVWGSFRVARRARPGPVFWRDEVDCVVAQGEHDGYRRLPLPVTHRRTVAWRRDRFWLFVEELLGEAETAADSYVHLHPDLSLEQLDDSSWRIRGTRAPLWLTAFGQQRRTDPTGVAGCAREGWYSERFGELRRNTVLAIHRRGALPGCFGYVISKRSGAEVDVAHGAQGNEVHVMHEGERDSFGLAGGAVIHVR
jgi:uncharacterized heparinase superfamily protein